MTDNARYAPDDHASSAMVAQSAEVVDLSFMSINNVRGIQVAEPYAPFDASKLKAAKIQGETPNVIPA